ncbi:hypothetical protein EDD11_009050 [Mortierella claussenii]|nr:hypothetical protein EDD11_009050 [Mortierella claussenii]
MSVNYLNENSGLDMGHHPKQQQQQQQQQEQHQSQQQQHQRINDKRRALGLPGLTINSITHNIKRLQGSAGGGLCQDNLSPPRSVDSAWDSASFHNFSLSTISKTSYDDSRSFTSSNGSSIGSPQQQQQQPQSSQHSIISVRKRSLASSFLRSPSSPGGLGASSNTISSSSSYGPYSGRVFPELMKEETALVHCPVSVASIDQFSAERYAWVKDCLYQQGPKGAAAASIHLNSVLKSERAWDTVEGYGANRSSPEELIAPGLNTFAKAGYINLKESTGLVLVKLMQVTNKASSKLLDIECNLRVGGVERTSQPSRSFKGNPGNTATMNEVFLFDVDKPFQLELEVTGTPVVTKFGTMAGFSNTQIVHLGQLILPLPLEPMEKSIRTYKLQRLTRIEGTLPSSKGIKIQSKDNADYEIVIMMGVHVLKEPVEDRSWETKTLFEGNLTVMTRGSRMASWKRYWAVLQGNTFKLYDAEYQLKRDPIAIIPLAFVQDVQPPDFDKVDVGSNGFSVVIDPKGVNMSNAHEFDLTDMDYHLYAFTDSAFLLESWTTHLQDALEQFNENMAKRHQVQIARRDRLRRSMLGERCSSLDYIYENGPQLDLIDLRFVS